MAKDLGNHSSLYLTPLFGGIEPERGWKMLRLFEEQVLPHLACMGVKPLWGMPQPKNINTSV